MRGETDEGCETCDTKMSIPNTNQAQKLTSAIVLFNDESAAERFFTRSPISVSIFLLALLNSVIVSSCDLICCDICGVVWCGVVSVTIKQATASNATNLFNFGGLGQRSQLFLERCDFIVFGLELFLRLLF